MKSPVLLLGICVALGILLAGGPSRAQKGISLTPVVPPARTTTSLAPSCTGEALLEVSIDAPQAMRISNSKPVGASAWSTELTLTGRVQKSGQTCAAEPVCAC